MEIDSRVIASVCERNDVRTLRIFGSFARGESDDRSDVDLLVEFDGRKSLLDLVRIEREFSDQLGRKVDLVTRASLSPFLQERIVRGSRILYERDG